MKNLKKYILSFIILTLVVSTVFTNNPSFLKQLNNKIYNILFSFKNTSYKSNNIVIVDIDDKSIDAIGQWPWSRNITAEIIRKLEDLKVKAIGVDIVFSEEDRSSPSNLLEKINLEIENIPNYDKIFSDSILNSKVPVILGYHFLNKQTNKISFERPYIPAIFTKSRDDIKTLLIANSINLNIPIIQDSAHSSGFLNATSDEIGIIRQMPLIIEYDKQIYPSLALEVIRTLKRARQVNIKFDKQGAKKIVLADLKIPVDNSGLFNVNYINNTKVFTHISSLDLLTDNFTKFDKNSLKDKIILLGSSASGIVNYNTTPLNTKVTSTEIQATIIENLLNKDFLYTPDNNSRFIILSILFFSLISLVILFFNSVILSSFVHLIAVTIFSFVTYYLFIYKGILIDSIYILLNIIATYILSIYFIFTKDKKELKIIKNKFATKVSQDVMSDLLKSESFDHLTTKKRDITIFFSDIVSFTKITDSIDDPEKLTLYLNEYMNPMTNIIMKNKGTVDKFIGDSIMAYWNAPNEVKDHHDLALSSALQQLSALEKLNKKYEERFLPRIKIRIGLNSGEAFVGEMGADIRNDYTAIGDAVNKAAVLEQICKIYGSACVISQSVKEGLKNQYTMRVIDKIQIENTSSSFFIYEVFKIGKANNEEKAEIDKFEKAFYLYQEERFEEALDILNELINLKKQLNKKVIEIYINRCNKAKEQNNFSSTLTINKKLISN